MTFSLASPLYYFQGTTPTALNLTGTATNSGCVVTYTLSAGTPDNSASLYAAGGFSATTGMLTFTALSVNGFAGTQALTVTPAITSIGYSGGSGATFDVYVCPSALASGSLPTIGPFNYVGVALSALPTLMPSGFVNPPSSCGVTYNVLSVASIGATTTSFLDSTIFSPFTSVAGVVTVIVNTATTSHVT